MGNNPIFPTTKGILRKLGGDKISGKVLTWDGDKNDEIELPDGICIKRIADFVDMTKVESVTAEAIGAGITTFSKSQLTVNTIGEGDLIQYALSASDIPMLLSFNVGLEGVEAGTYVISTGTGFRFISATTSETIVPIDPKYLPTGGGSGGLPVVELETVIFGDSDETVLSAADSAKMDALNGEACILKFSFSMMGDVANVRAIVGSFGFGSLYTYITSVYVIGIYAFTNETDDGTWICQRGE